MRQVHWTIPFKSIDETEYTINIYEEGYSGDVVTLVGAGTPIVTEEDNNGDPFLPVRYQTGYIRVIDTEGSLMDEIMPENNTDRYVELVSNGVVKWMGYIQCDMYSSVWDATPYEIALPVVSVLGMLKQIEYDAAPGIPRLCSVLCDCIKKAGNFRYVLFPKTYETVDVRTSFINLAFIPQEVQAKVSVLGSDIPEPSRKTTYYSVLEELCKYYGVQACEYGDTIIFSVDNSAEYWRVSVNDMQGGNLTDSVTYETIEMPLVVGTNHTISRTRPMKQVRISTPLELFDKTILSHDDINYLQYINTYNKEDIKSKYSMDDVSEDAYIKSYQYHSTEGRVVSNWPDKQMIITEWDFSDFKSMSLVGGVALIDSLGFNNEAGAHVTISESNILPGADVDTGYPAVEITSRRMYASQDLQLQLHMKAVGVAFDNTIIEDRVTLPSIWYELQFIKEDDGMVYYYQGNNIWRTERKYLYFNLSIFHEDWQTFPMSNWIGKYKIVIHCFVDTRASDIKKLHPIKYLRFEDISLNLAYRNSAGKIDKKYDLSSIERVSVIPGDSTEMYKMQTMLFRNRNLIPGNSEYKVHYTYCGIGAENALWQKILERMKNWYSVPRSCINVSLQCKHLCTANRLSFLNDNYIIGAQSVDWRDNNNKVKIYKL